MKTKLISRFNALLTSLLAFLGFGCSTISPEYGSPPVICIYGVPKANVMLSGKVTDGQGQPLQNIQIDVREQTENYKYTAVYTYTDETGNYVTRFSDFLPPDSLMLIARDTTEQYLTDSVKLPIKYDNPDKSNSWDFGNASVTADFVLKQNTSENPAQ